MEDEDNNLDGPAFSEVTDEWKAKIIHGSPQLQNVVTNLVCNKVPHAAIHSVCQNPAYAISAHALAQRDPWQYVQHCIDKAIAPELAELNSEYAVITDYGGKCRILHETDSPKLSFMHLNDFKAAFCNKKIRTGTDENGEPTYRPLGVWWIGHRNRRQYDKVVFAPDRKVKNAFNLWRGWACDEKEGDCALFFNFVYDIICDGKIEHYDWLVNWMAYCVQHPAEQGHTAVVLRGKEGIGKGFFASAFGSLLRSPHYLAISDPGKLVGNFNAHRRACVVLFADEAFFAGDKKHKAILKALITEETFMAEAKGVDAESAPNYVHLIMASNEDWVVPVGLSDRRFFVLDVPATRITDTAYFSKLQTYLDRGGREEMLYYLRHRNLSNFNVRLRPETSAGRDQKEYSLGPLHETWLGWLREGFPGEGEHRIGANGFISAAELACAARDATKRPVSVRAAGRFLGPKGLGLVRVQVNGCNRYMLRSLDEERISWDRTFKTLAEDWN